MVVACLHYCVVVQKLPKLAKTSTSREIPDGGDDKPARPKQFWDALYRLIACYVAMAIAAVFVWMHKSPENS
jgi:hypothetical protein